MPKSSLQLPAMLAAALLGGPLSPGAGEFAHFEARQTRPLAVTPDGRTLLALNSPEARLALFDISASASAVPVRFAEIPVGLEPVAVQTRDDREAWVVNEVSDSISIVALDQHAVVATLPCADEPGDVVFAQGRAYVSCARNRVLRVFDAERRSEIASVPLEGVQPRALAVDATGTHIAVAFLHSGNGTTILPSTFAPSPGVPTNPALGPAPSTALIVDANDPRIPFHVLDHDVALLDTSEPSAVRYLGGLGTSLLALEFVTNAGELWVAGTEANNRIRFEPNLRGVLVSNQIARVRLETDRREFLDLSPFDAQGRALDPAGPDAALAQPSALATAPGEDAVWLAAFASDRVARIPLDTGAVAARIDLRAAGESSAAMRGPRGLVWRPERKRLYVLNKLSHTVSTIDTQDDRVLSEVPLGPTHPLPAEARAGRGLLFDARLSGNGASSCGSCHLDADVDGLAWDLGDPGGSSVTVLGANLAVHDPTPRERVMHPMKGPMVTQTLRGLAPGKRLHWRGDRATLADFNGTFRDLLGGPLRAASEIAQLQAYLNTLRHHPNPHRNPDDSLPESLAGGNAARGEKLFGAHLHHCAVCHVLPEGTDHNLDDPRNLRLSQPVQNPSLHTTYQRALFDPRPGVTNLTGFGLLHDGTGSARALPTVHFYDLDALSGTAFNDVAAYVLSFDTGTPAFVGRQFTFSSTHPTRSETDATLDQLERLAARSGAADLVLQGRWKSRSTQFLFDPESNLYLTDRRDTVRSREELTGALLPDDTLTALLLRSGLGWRFSLDRNQNQTFDGDEPAPRLAWIPDASGAFLNVESQPPGWLLEFSPAPAGAWEPWTAMPARGPIRVHAGPDPGGIFRLRRSW